LNSKSPHNLLLEEYKDRYEELEHQMLEILSWRFRWFGKPEPSERSKVEIHINFHSQFNT
jgi:hypothetical protein